MHNNRLIHTYAIISCQCKLEHVGINLSKGVLRQCISVSFDPLTPRKLYSACMELSVAVGFDVL